MILGGGDWTDASVDHVYAPVGFDLDAANDSYQRWLSDDYWPALSRWNKIIGAVQPEFLGFPEWLVRHGHCATATVEEYVER